MTGVEKNNHAIAVNSFLDIGCQFLHGNGCAVEIVHIGVVSEQVILPAHIKLSAAAVRGDEQNNQIVRVGYVGKPFVAQLGEYAFLGGVLIGEQFDMIG